MRVTLVAALGRNRVIGAGGGMPWHLPDDLAHFKRTTMGGVMVMGRKTFDSIGRPLPGRRSIVVTRDTGWSFEGVEVAHSLPDAVALAGDGASVFVVGGGEIYAQALPIADRLELTEVHAVPEGDTWFPEWSRDEWVETAREPHEGFDFVTWERV
ncbi:type 3 dihydrofolate reductase [Okibacterium endophyticum]